MHSYIPDLHSKEQIIQCYCAICDNSSSYSQERNSYKEILDTYEGEATINIAGMADKRIQKLEDIAKKYREELDRLEKCLSERDCQVSEYKTKAELVGIVK